MIPTNPQHIFNAPIIERKTIADGATEVVFDVGENSFAFSPGQYIRVTLRDLSSHDYHESYRDFSISSAPADLKQRRISVSFRNSESDFKKMLLAMPIGTPVQISGPFGSFLLPKNIVQPIVFVAGGTGVTPFMSMLRHIAAEHLPYRVTLLYGNKDESSTLHLPELNALTKQIPNFSLHTIFGPIDGDVIKKHIDTPAVPHRPNSARQVWYIAGSSATVSAVEKSLTEIGVSPAHIRTELFTGYVPAYRPPARFAWAGDEHLPERSSQSGGAGRPADDAEREEFLHTKISDEAQSKAIFNALNKSVLVSETDLEGTIVYANDQFVEISKYSREELIGQNHRLLKSGEHSDSFYHDLWNTIMNGHVFRGEIKNRAKDGTYYWVDANIAPVLDDKGKIIRYIAIRFPITERKEAEEKLKARTVELEENSKLMVGRELRMIELKEELAALKERIKQGNDTHD